MQNDLTINDLTKKLGINFKTKLNLIKDYPDCDLSYIINAPILKNNKVIGMITDYNLETDEASGYIFCTDIGINLLNNKIVSMEIINWSDLENAE